MKIAKKHIIFLDNVYSISDNWVYSSLSGREIPVTWILYRNRPEYIRCDVKMSHISIKQFKQI